MESSHFLSSLLILHLLVFVSSAPAPLPSIVGGYEPIEDPNDPYVVEIAKFAVAEHNRETSDHLSFVKVSSGQQQVVAGMNYDLVIVASLGAEGQYRAVVYDIPWQPFRTLTSFDKL